MKLKKAACLLFLFMIRLKTSSLKKTGEMILKNRMNSLRLYSKVLKFSALALFLFVPFLASCSQEEVVQQKPEVVLEERPYNSIVDE